MRRVEIMMNVRDAAPPETSGSMERVSEKRSESNQGRDEANRQKLLELGWRVLTVWECSLHACRHDPVPLIDQINEWLVGNSRLAETTPEGELKNDK